MIKQYLDNYVAATHDIVLDFLTNIEEHNIGNVNYLNDTYPVILDDLMAHQDYNSNYRNDLVAMAVTNPFYKQKPSSLLIQVGWFDTLLTLNVEVGSYDGKAVYCQFPITEKADLSVVKLARNICNLAKKVKLKQIREQD